MAENKQVEKLFFSKDFFESIGCKADKERFLVLLGKKRSRVVAEIIEVILAGDKKKISILRDFICQTVNLSQWNGLRSSVRESNLFTESRKSKALEVLNGFIRI